MEKIFRERSNLNYGKEMIKSYLSQIDGDAEKIKIVHEIFLKDTDLLPSESEIFHPKNDDASLNARKEGNNFFIHNDYLSALNCYNRSISLATDNSENLAIGYANRSAVYLKSGFYKFCLQNIEFALKNNYPEKLKSKLEQRQKECLELMNNHEDSLEKLKKEELEKNLSIKLSYPVNERMPCMIEGLELARSEQLGRYIRSKHDLFPGDIVFAERPFVKHVIANSEFSRCANCLHHNHLNLVPCGKCTRALFCSEHCRQEAWKRFHKYECPIIDAIFDFFKWSIMSTIRLTIFAFTMFDEPEELENWIKQIDVKTENAFDLDYSKMTEKQYFRSIYAQETNESKQDVDDWFMDMTDCAITWHLLSNYTDLHLLLKTEAMKDFFLNTLTHFCQVSNHNSLSLRHPEECGEYGIGFFALCSLLNHSCAPNVGQVGDGIRNVVVVKRVIKAGEPLCENYGGFAGNHLHTVKEERQLFLKADYKFDCRCEACINNYPLLNDLPFSFEWYEWFEPIKRRIFNNDKVFAKKKLNEFKSYLKDNYKKYPSLELCQTELCLVRSLAILMSEKSLAEQLKPLNK